MVGPGSGKSRPDVPEGVEHIRVLAGGGPTIADLYGLPDAARGEPLGVDVSVLAGLREVMPPEAVDMLETLVAAGLIRPEIMQSMMSDALQAREYMDDDRPDLAEEIIARYREQAVAFGMGAQFDQMLAAIE